MLKSGIQCLWIIAITEFLDPKPNAPGFPIGSFGYDGGCPDLEPGSTPPYRGDGEGADVGTTLILNLRGLWPQFTAKRSEQIPQRRTSRILRGITYAAILRPCPLVPTTV